MPNSPCCDPRRPFRGPRSACSTPVPERRSTFPRRPRHRVRGWSRGRRTAGTTRVSACTGGENQRWLVTAAAGGGFTVTSKRSGLVLTAAGAADGTPLTQQPDTSAADRRRSFG
ncbi:RICIN domain-containing protein [Streptomyces sp. NPDC003719]